MKTRGQLESEAIAASHAGGMSVFFQKRVLTGGNIQYRIFRETPTGKSVLIKTTSDAAMLVRMMRRERGEKTKSNPSRREDAAGAESLATRFVGRAPEDHEFVRVRMPKLPKAMTNIGKIFAIEYLAERDGKEYRFRHVFKAKSRPHLAVSPDGKICTMIGGSWHFTEDGFEDL